MSSNALWLFRQGIISKGNPIAATLVQQAHTVQNTTSQNISATLSGTVTEGNQLIVCAGCVTSNTGSATLSSLSSGTVSTWSPNGAQDLVIHTINTTIQVGTIETTFPGPQTVSATFGNTIFTDSPVSPSFLSVSEWSGMNMYDTGGGGLGDPTDISFGNDNNGPSSTLDPGATSQSETYELLIAFGYASHSPTIGAPTGGFTDLIRPASSGAAVAYLVTTTPVASKDCTWSSSISNNWNAIIQPYFTNISGN